MPFFPRFFLAPGLTIPFLTQVNFQVHYANFVIKVIVFHIFLTSDMWSIFSESPLFTVSFFGVIARALQCVYAHLKE
jgi:hypothetical protein